MINVTQLGYAGVNVVELDALEHVLDKICGAEVSRDDNRLYARVDERHHRMAFYAADKMSLAYMGLEVESLDALRAAEDELRGKGLEVTRATAAEREERAVLDMIHLKGPDGIRIELYFGALVEKLPFKPGRAISGFVTGDLGLGHVVLASADREAATRFYTEHFSFRLTDYIFWDEAEATFLHCNPRHHTLALMNPCFGMVPGQFNHLMLQVASLDDVGRAYDMVQQMKIPMVMTLGRHTNDQMTSFYIKTESGFAIEYGYGGVEVDDRDWDVKVFNAPGLWGHTLAA
jgi:2,3-dihydroxybiphenyl 1,2-dioxygenase